jgi:hypothetical protein
LRSRRVFARYHAVPLAWSISIRSRIEALARAISHDAIETHSPSTKGYSDRPSHHRKRWTASRASGRRRCPHLSRIRLRLGSHWSKMSGLRGLSNGWAARGTTGSRARSTRGRTRVASRPGWAAAASPSKRTHILLEACDNRRGGVAFMQIAAATRRLICLGCAGRFLSVLSSMRIIPYRSQMTRS